MTSAPATTLFYLPAFGSSSGAFDAVAAELPDDVRVVGIDLPGYGDAADDPRFTTEATTDAVLERIARHRSGRWVLVGHSRGGRIASLVARRALDGTAPVFGFAGVVLLAPSPPSPEPIDEDARQKMLTWGRSGELTLANGEDFVASNTAAALPGDVRAAAVADVARANPAAWTQWLETGYAEGLTALVGELDVPALILGGSEDPMLGTAAQRRLHAEVYPRAIYETLMGAKHLLPLEKPAEVAGRIAAFLKGAVEVAPRVPDSYARMLAGDHVSARTRGVLAARAVPDDPRYRPRAVTERQLTTLRQLAALVVPQTEHPIDLAARVDAQLARREGDGWRDASLPPDIEAYRTALDALAGNVDRDTVAALVDGSADLDGGFDAAQLSAWFADCRVDLARQWLAHPATMARIGSDAIATAGDGPVLQGFRLLGAGEREEWEPELVLERPSDIEGAAS